MSDPIEDFGDRGGAGPPLFSSARVRLEVAILATDQSAPAAAATTADGREPQLVLIVAGDEDVRHYVRESLRDLGDVRVLEASTSARARELAAAETPRLLIVDTPEAGVLTFLTGSAAILIADDDDPPHARPSNRVHLLTRPFSAQAILRAVSRSLA